MFLQQQTLPHRKWEIMKFPEGLANTILNISLGFTVHLVRFVVIFFKYHEIGCYEVIFIDH